MAPTRIKKGSSRQAFHSYKKTYLEFLRAIHQTQLVFAVAEHYLHDFPKGLPPSAASAVTKIFTQMSSALLDAVSRIDATGNKKIDHVPNGDPPNATITAKSKRMRPHANDEAMEIAMNALHLMLASDLSKKDPSPGFGKGFQVLARNQAVAMLYAYTDAFFGDTLRVICRTRPEVLRTGKQLTWETALGFESIGHLEETLTEQFTYEFGWKTVADRLKFLRDKLGVDLVIDARQLELLTLFEQRRHLIIHNGGVATAKYIADYGRYTCKNRATALNISRRSSFARSRGHDVGQ